MHSGGTVRSGHEALLQLAESVPDLVISDIRMPGMDGYKLARQLRGSPRMALVPIYVILTKLHFKRNISTGNPHVSATIREHLLARGAFIHVQRQSLFC
jgi:CheY-like chemotaxis protein